MSVLPEKATKIIESLELYHNEYNLDGKTRLTIAYTLILGDSAETGPGFLNRFAYWIKVQELFKEIKNKFHQAEKAFDDRVCYNFNDRDGNEIQLVVVDMELYDLIEKLKS